MFGRAAITLCIGPHSIVYSVHGCTYHLNDLLYAKSQLDVDSLSDVRDGNGESIVAARAKQFAQ